MQRQPWNALGWLQWDSGPAAHWESRGKSATHCCPFLVGWNSDSPGITWLVGYNCRGRKELILLAGPFARSRVLWLLKICPTWEGINGPSGHLAKQQKYFPLGQAQVGGWRLAHRFKTVGARPVSKTPFSIISPIRFLPGVLCSQNFWTAFSYCPHFFLSSLVAIAINKDFKKSQHTKWKPESPSTSEK